MENRPDKTIFPTHDLAKLLWATRRGMLELDILLGKFLKERYLSLKPTDQGLFIELLACADQELYVWLLGQEQPEDRGLAYITQLIIQHARCRV